MEDPNRLPVVAGCVAAGVVVVALEDPNNPPLPPAG